MLQNNSIIMILVFYTISNNILERKHSSILDIMIKATGLFSYKNSLKLKGL